MLRFNKLVIYVMLTVVICSVFCSCSISTNSVYIFSDIVECNNLESNKSNAANVITLDSVDDDPNLNELEYNEFYAIKYESQDMKFEIFAYEFTNRENAKSYFESSAKRDCVSSRDFYVSTTLISYTVRVLDGERAYILYSKPKYKEAIDKYLSEAFSIEFNNEDLLESIKNSIDQKS